jgi:hypothetical protein
VIEEEEGTFFPLVLKDDPEAADDIARLLTMAFMS